MGCTIECSVCCKKKNKKKNKPAIDRKDTKFVAESYQHLKIEIKNNNNSNSKEIPLINNFFKETLGRQNERNSIKSQSINSKTQKGEEKKEINENIEPNKNIVSDNLYKGENEKILEGIIKEEQSEKSKSNSINNKESNNISKKN